MNLYKAVPFLMVLEVSLAVKLIMIPPEPETYVFFGGQSTFICSSNNGSFDIQWYFNDTLYDPFSDQYEDWEIWVNQHFLYSSTITIGNIVKELNNTVLRCSAVVNEDRLYSNNSTFLLEGVPENVSNVTTSIKDSFIFISWEAPFSINSAIYYGVEILSELVGIVCKNVTETNYTIECNNSCRVACSNWTIAITPINKVAQVGEAAVITLFNEDRDPKLLKYELMERSSNDYHLILTVTQPLCKIKDFHIINKYIESGNYEESNFKQFVLTKRSLTSQNYVYELEVNFEKRFEYNISMILETNTKSKKWTGNISTHNSYNITLMEYSNSFLSMQLHHNDHSDGSTGAFLSLLHCKNSSCDDIDYDNSVYALIHSTEPISLQSNYKIGHYLMYIFDANINGSLLPSIDNKCFSITGQKVYLDISLPDDFKSSTNNFCSLIYNNRTVSSSCQSDKIPNIIQKQLIVQSTNALLAQIVYISNATDITERECVEYEGTSYGIITGINGFNILPIGRGFIKFTRNSKQYSDKQVCIDSGSSNWIWILASSITAVVICASIHLIIICGHRCQLWYSNHRNDDQVLRNNNGVDLLYSRNFQNDDDDNSLCKTI